MRDLALSYGETLQSGVATFARQGAHVAHQAASDPRRTVELPPTDAIDHRDELLHAALSRAVAADTRLGAADDGILGLWDTECGRRPRVRASAHRSHRG